MGAKSLDENFGRLFSWRLLGLGFWQAWWMISMCTQTLFPSSNLSPYIGNPTLWILFLTTLGYIVIVASAKRFSPFSSRAWNYLLAGGLTASGSLAVPCSLYFGQELFGSMLFFLGSLGIALGNALLLIMWGELWSSLATGRVGQHLYVSYTFAFVLFFACYALPKPLALVLTTMFPVLSALVLYACRNEPRRKPSVIPLNIKTVPIGRILICIALISIVYGASQGIMPTFTESDHAFVVKGLLFAGTMLAAITIYMLISPCVTEPVLLYRPIIPTIITGLLLLVLLPNHYQFFGTGLIIMGIYFLDMLMMLESTDVAFRARMPVALSFGLAIIFARVGTLLGFIIANLLISFHSVTADTRMHLFLIEILILTFIGMLFFTQQDIQKLYSVEHIKSVDNSLEHKCRSVSGMCQLTKRESEVLILLARGRSVRYICDQLSIAQGTAKHHVSNIYRKVGVFDRQGLLDAIEEGGVGKHSME